MLRGVTRPEETQSMGLSRRLMVRVGALLKKKIEITLTVLESAKPGTALETTLLDAALLDNIEKLGAADLQRMPGLEHCALAQGPEGIRVLCLDEEIDAQDAWSAAEPSATPQTTSLVIAPAENSTAYAAGEALFSRHELDRLRLKLLTASSPQERMEALRILAHAPLTANEKCESIFAALEDRDPGVRAEGAQGLVQLGVESGLGEQLQSLCLGEERLKLRSAEELAKRLRAENIPALEVTAMGICALAALKTEEPGTLAAALMDMLALTVPALTPFPNRLRDVVRVSLEKLARAGDQGHSFGALSRVYVPLQRLHKALYERAPDAVRALMEEERARTASSAVDAFLLQILLEGTPAGDPREAAQLKSCADFLARDTQEGRDSRSVGVSLARRGAAAIGPLSEAFPTATGAAQKYMLRLIEDIVRFHTSEASNPNPEVIGKADLELAAGMVRSALESGSRGLRMAAMSLRFVTRPELSEKTRQYMAENFLNHLDDFGFETEREHAEDVIAHFDLPAIEPLVRRLAPERPHLERVTAIRILGNLALELHPARGEMGRYSEAVTDLIRKLKEITLESGFKDRETLYTAMGKLAASPAATKQAADVAVRQLIDALKAPSDIPPSANGLPDSTRLALEGLTWVAASRRAFPELIATVIGILRRVIEEAQDDLTSQETMRDGEPVIEISGGNGMLELLPSALNGISRIGRSHSTPPGTTRELVRLLIERWQKISAGELVWGPVNGMLLVRTLNEIGSEPHIEDTLRMEILKGLAPRLSHPQVFQAVGRICAVGDSPYLAPAALTLGQGIFNLRMKDGRFDPEDRPELLKALARIGTCKHLGAPTSQGIDRARRFRDSIVEDLMQGLQDFIPGCLDALKVLRDAKVLSPEKQELVERRLSDLYALQKT